MRLGQFFRPARSATWLMPNRTQILLGADPGIHGGGGRPVLASGLGTTYWTYLYLKDPNDCQKTTTLELFPLDWQPFPLDEHTSLFFQGWGTPGVLK